MTCSILDLDPFSLSLSLSLSLGLCIHADTHAVTDSQTEQGMDAEINVSFICLLLTLVCLALYEEMGVSKNRGP